MIIRLKVEKLKEILSRTPINSDTNWLAEIALEEIERSDELERRLADLEDAKGEGKK